MMDNSKPMMPPAGGKVPGIPGSMPPMGGKPPMMPGGMPGGHEDFGPGGPPDGWTPPMADISWVERKYLDLPYGSESPAQCLDLYLPAEGSGPWPLLVHIHGGGFAMGDKRDDHMDAYLKGLKRGFAVASVEYRLSGEAVFPAAVLDCRSAVRYLRTHAAEYGIDADRICTIGGSAGGNLSAMLGMNIANGAFCGEAGKTFECEPTVAACVDQFGPMFFKDMDDQARENGISFVNHDEPFSPESKYLGVAVPDAPQSLADAANPAAYAGPDMCPMLVQHGTMDHLVPYAQSEEFVRALTAAGCGSRVRFIPLEGADHEDAMFVSDKNLDTVFAFLTSALGM